MDFLILDDPQKFVTNYEWEDIRSMICDKTGIDPAINIKRDFHTICVSSGLDYSYMITSLAGLLDASSCFFIDIEALKPFAEGIRQEVIDCSKNDRYKECVKLLVRKASGNNSKFNKNVTSCKLFFRTLS